MENIYTENEKWQAVINCKKEFDSIFLYGVRTTGIFCRPSCKAKTPARINVVFFDSVDEALKAGFRPCKKCCPDQAVHEPDRELVNNARIFFEANYNEPVNLSSLSRRLGVSANHLARLYKQYTGITPAQHIAGLRLKKALELIGKTDSDILEVAYASGFTSLSNFYRCFKERTGYTPRQYRKNGVILNANANL